MGAQPKGWKRENQPPLAQPRHRTPLARTLPTPYPRTHPLLSPLLHTLRFSTPPSLPRDGGHAPRRGRRPLGRAAVLPPPQGLLPPLLPPAPFVGGGGQGVARVGCPRRRRGGPRVPASIRCSRPRSLLLQIFFRLGCSECSVHAVRALLHLI